MRIKGLLLGSAAALAAVSGAQAADLPVKAKAVAQYVKICTLYGSGFYYIPGTDTCIKLGGYVRADYYYNARGGGTPLYANSTDSNNSGRFTRTDTSEYATRHRAAFAIDARQESAYGTVRSLFQFGFNNENAGGGGEGSDIYYNRGLIQFAGFTIGRSKSPFNIWSCDDSCRHAQNQASSSNSSGGSNQLSYTAEFGGGFSGTVYIEESRKTNVINTPTTIISGGQSYPAQHYPDFGVNLLLNQAWGYVGVSAAAHDASGGYYGTTTLTGHPADRLGFAVEGGAEIKLPWLGQGDRFGIDVAYHEGYFKNGNGNNLGSPQLYGSGNSVALGVASDGVYLPGGSVQLTSGWSINTGIEHFWAPNLRTSAYFIYSQVMYNDTVRNGRYFCPTGVVVSNCDPDWAFYQIGSRTLWTPVTNLNIGLDVFYTGIESAYKGTATLAASGARPAGSYEIRDMGIVTGTLRIQKNLVAGGD